MVLILESISKEGWSATSSGHWSGNPPDYVFDGITGTRWLHFNSAGSDRYRWLQIDMGAHIKVLDALFSCFL